MKWNDACVVVAENIAGSHEEFVSMMNEKAKALKLKNTHFVNCTGLHDKNHYTCAKDLSTMAYTLLIRRASCIVRVSMTEVAEA